MLLRFYCRSVAFAACFIVVLLAYAALPAPPREVSYLEALLDKHEMLGRESSKKVVIVGGSNVAFGMDSRELEESLGRPVINAGLNAGLGLMYPLRDVARYLSPGDLLVVIPEYELFQGSGRGGSALAALLVDVDREGWQFLSMADRLALLEYLGPYLCRKVIYWCEVWGNNLLGRTVVDAGFEIYNRRSFNEFGDIVTHWELPSEQVTPYGELRSLRVSGKVLQFLADYKREITGAGVGFVLLPPVLQASSFDNRKRFIETLDAELKDSGIEFDASPERYRFDDEMFFDTPYHLNKSGVERRMELLAEDLTRIPLGTGRGESAARTD